MILIDDSEEKRKLELNRVHKEIRARYNQVSINQK